MADYKEYDVEIKKDKIIISPHEPMGCSGFIAILVGIIVIVALINSMIPKKADDYKIKKGQTDYSLQPASQTIICYGNSTFDLSRFEIVGDYDYLRVRNENSAFATINGRFQRLTGSIGLPVVYSTSDDKHFFEYWDSKPVPLGASIDMFTARFDNNESTYQRMINTIKREASAVARAHNLFVLTIYGDGRLLYTSPIMIEQSAPVSFDINVSGVNQVEFRWNCAYMVYGNNYGLTKISVHNLQGHTN